MNREFKFRVFNNHDAIMMYFDFDDLHKQKFADEGFFPWEAIREEVIMQYIGIEDKNGKKIFEGDIIKDDDDISLVMFNKIGYDGEWNGLTGFGLDDWKTADSFYELEYGFDPKEIIIIGNIYENPELLKKV